MLAQVRSTQTGKMTPAEVEKERSTKHPEEEEEEDTFKHEYEKCRENKSIYTAMIAYSCSYIVAYKWETSWTQAWSYDNTYMAFRSLCCMSSFAA